jgi:signal transduction histidine kinase
LVTEAISMVRRDPAGAHVRIDVEGADGTIAADAELLRAALLNLLLNAAQAVGEHGTIQVRTSVTQDSAIVEIRDNGPGIPEALREKVLEPFFTTKSRGGGLGLPIARRSAELHGGSLGLACPDGGGTVATLTLPLPAARPVVSTRTSRSDIGPDRG